MTCRTAKALVMVVAVAGLTGCETLPPELLPADPTASTRETFRRAIAVEPLYTGFPTPSETLDPPPLGTGSDRVPRVVAGFRRGGIVSAPPRSAAGLVQGPIKGAEMTLDFENVDLPTVAALILEDGLGASYAIDPRVQGTVTLRSNGPLAVEQLRPTLEELLRINGAALVERAGVLTVVPRETAGAAAALPGLLDAAGTGFSLRVTPLRHVRVEDIAETLDAFAPVEGAIRYNRARNIVFSLGSSAEQTTIADVIAALDVDYFAGRSLALRPLTQAEAGPVAEELELAFQTPDGEASRALRVLAVERMDAVLIVADTDTLLDAALSLVDGLDQAKSDAPRLRILPVANRRANDLARVLGEIFNVAAVVPAVTAPLASRSGPRDRADTDDDNPPAPAATGLGTARPGPSSPVGLVPPSTGRGGIGIFRIVADDASNALIVLASDDGFEALRGALRRLDIRPLQVMIEATLLEVALRDELNFGVRWFLGEGNFSTGFGDAAGTGLADLLPGFNAAFRTSNARLTISALDAVTDVKVLSSPTLLVLDNEEARLQVGDQVPVTTRTSQAVDNPNAPLVTEEEFRDTGVILTVTPRVNAGGNIVLDLVQEVSTVVNSPGATNPTFAQRVVESTISVANGETIALAGLIEGQTDFGRDGIPALSRLPVIGAAFGASETLGNRRELIVLIRPVILRNEVDSRLASEELRRKLRSLDPQSFAAPPAYLDRP